MSHLKELSQKIDDKSFKIGIIMGYIVIPLIWIFRQKEMLALGFNIDATAIKSFEFIKFTSEPGLVGHCISIDPFYPIWQEQEFEKNTRFIELIEWSDSVLDICNAILCGRGGIIFFSISTISSNTICDIKVDTQI